MSDAVSDAISGDVPRWYKAGLRFGCTQCGRCCTGAPGYVWMTKKEIVELATHLDMSVDAFAKRFLRRVGRRLSLKEKANNDCVFYDQGCTVYSARPQQCRTYPFWPENVKSQQDWQEVAQECPGVGEGTLYSVQDIQRILGGDGDASS